MYPSSRIASLQTKLSNASVVGGGGRGGFRPVALPALAAAVHVNATALRAARSEAAARSTARIPHEDEPAE